MNDTLLIVANLVIACATVAAAIAAIDSARCARKAVNDQQANFDRQIGEYRLALFAETTLKFEERFNDPQFQRIRSKAAKGLLTNKIKSKRKMCSTSLKPWGCLSSEGIG